MVQKVFLFISTIVVLSVFAADIEHMVVGEAPSEIERDPEMSVIVMHANTNFHIFKGVYNYFIDDEFIGQDKRNSYFIAKVKPGTRYLYITLKGKVYNVGRFDFKPNKIYYILRKSCPGGNILLTQKPEEFQQFVKEETPEFLIRKEGSGEPDKVKEKRLKKAKEEFDEEVEDDPGRHEDVLKYPGY